MPSINKTIVFCLCVISLLGGFVAAPVYDFFCNLDYSNMTDSAYVSSDKIDIENLNTPHDGYHTWISPKGNMYIGIWENGILERGTLITEKSVYEGELLNLSPHGYGTMYYNNGNIYRGNWAAGNKEGVGLKLNRDGSMFFGHWRAGLFNAPKNMEFKVEDRVYGIDLSRYQKHTSVKWKELALYSDMYGDVYAHKTDMHSYMQPVVFAFIKATQGIKQDPNYQYHLNNARKHHVIVGSYHFFTIDDDIDAQIANFTQSVKISKGDLPPVLDIESEYRDQKAYISKLRRYGLKRMRDDAIKWLSSVEHYYGVKPIIYTSETWKKNFLADKRFESYEFWISRYNNIEPTRSKWTFWQRTDRAVPRGYEKEIDVNIYSGDYKSFLKYRSGIYK